MHTEGSDRFDINAGFLNQKLGSETKELPSHLISLTWATPFIFLSSWQSLSPA